jgi:hypothetical protein
MSSNRAELVRRLIAYRAGVRVIEDALKAEGEHEHRENETVSTHRLAYATVAGSQTNDRIEVTDRDSFMAFMAGRFPDEVTTKTIQVVRNDQWLSQVKDAWATLSRDHYDATPAPIRAKPFPVVDMGGSVVPGAIFLPGGGYITTSVTPKMQARRRALQAARRGVLMGDWSDLEAVIADPTYLARREPDDEEDAVVTLAGVPVETTEEL